ncbi:MAG: TonB-dependent receptor plug domain-containing protein, partial [Pseudomonadota bacterium]|nr:TonB-dependent receptor plug domain-containing protein [Pseudomonadota bacterium]
MKTSMSKLTKNVRTALAASAAVSMLASVNAYAQESEEAAAKDVEKIAVVGTRAAPRSVGDSPVPVDIISSDEFQNQGATDMVSMMQTVVPSFNVNDQPINDASTLVRPANLRGMASDHTLVLVNGKRRHRSAVITFLGGGLSDGAQGPDISVIPSSALKQVEVLRDGAAAQYGSDAIAGVVNFVLKDADEGGMFEARYGSYYEGDGDMMQVSGNIGLPLSEKGFINLSAEYRT